MIHLVGLDQARVRLWCCKSLPACTTWRPRSNLDAHTLFAVSATLVRPHCVECVVWLRLYHQPRVVTQVATCSWSCERGVYHSPEFEVFPHKVTLPRRTPRPQRGVRRCSPADQTGPWYPRQQLLLLLVQLLNAFYKRRREPPLNRVLSTRHLVFVRSLCVYVGLGWVCSAAVASRAVPWSAGE